jgi:ParB-like chromosome segregation protein Spo0J
MSARAKVDHERLLVPISEVLPSPDNMLLYRPVTPDDAATIELAASIKENGILEEIVLTEDQYIVSGHRRHMAARIAGLREVPCRILNIRRGEDERGSDEFLKLLREHNRQRVKSRDEILREVVTDIDPLKAHRALTAYRKKKAKIKIARIEIRGIVKRKEISPAKMDFLHAINRVIEAQKDFWPLSLRQVHYQLLNDPPLIHSAKPDSQYRNDVKSYRALIDLVTRARHDGLIDYNVIDDPTRPVTLFDVHRNLSGYYAQQMKNLLNGYWRDLMQSQPNHIEIVVEKNTLRSIVEPVAARFCMPLTIGRGQCSTRPLYDIAQRYKRFGKEKLIILAVSDLDPDGDAIAHSLGQRLRDDFRVRKVEIIKCALTMRQVRELRLPKKYERAKTGSSNYDRFVRAYKTDYVWELEALNPKTLQKLLADSIDHVVDRQAFNAEVRQERADAAHNAAVREIVLRTLQTELTLPSERRP